MTAIIQTFGWPELDTITLKKLKKHLDKECTNGYAVVSAILGGGVNNTKQTAAEAVRLLYKEDFTLPYPLALAWFDVHTRLAAYDRVIRYSFATIAHWEWRRVGDCWKQTLVREMVQWDAILFEASEARRQCRAVMEIIQQLDGFYAQFAALKCDTIRYQLPTPLKVRASHRHQHTHATIVVATPMA